MLTQGGDKVAKVGYVAGTIQQDKLNNFERLLFRATRGNMYLRQVPVGKVVDPSTGEEQSKHVFVVFFAGERSRQKVNKVSVYYQQSVFSTIDANTVYLNHSDLRGLWCKPLSIP